MTEEMKAALLGGAIGSLASVFGSLVLVFIQERGDRKNLREGLRIEFAEIKDLMALKAFYVASHLGLLNREFLKWIQKAVGGHRGIQITPEMVRMLDGMLSKTDKELQATSETKKAPNDKGLSLKNIELPFLEVNLGKLSLLNVKEQSRALVVRNCISLVNQNIEEARFYYQATFAPGTHPENMEQLKFNCKESYVHVLRQLRRAVDQINDFLGPIQSA